MSDPRGLDPQGNPREITVNALGDQLVAGRVYEFHTRIPGIGTGAVYASGEAFGTSFVISGLPVSGTISNVLFMDLDDEGKAKELVLFRNPFTATADNNAFNVSDGDLKNLVGVVNITTFFNFNSNQAGIATPALSYFSADGRLYAQLVTRGTDNIAAGSIPEVTITVVE